MRVDRQVLRWVVRTVDAVTDISFRRERLEAMQEAGWDVQVPKGVVVEQECLLLTECRGLPANVDQHVVDRAARTPHQLGLAPPGPAVHPPQHALDRTRLGILHKTRRHPDTEVGIELVGVEGPGEQTPVITMLFIDEHQYIGQPRLLDLHEVIVA